ncbi:MAG: ABC transporter permease [Anaeroplasmataceae bacterium]
MKNSTLIRRVVYFILGIVFIYLAWFLYSLYLSNSLIFPSPNKTLATVFDLFTKSNTYLILLSTLYRLLLSLLFSFLIATSLSILASLYYRVEYFLKPIISILRSVPLACLIVVILVIFGITKSPIIIVTIMLIPIIYENLLSGYKNINIDLISTLKLESDINFKIYRKVIFAELIPSFKTSFVQTLGLGIKVLVMAEFICLTTYSIGKEVYNAKNNLEYDVVLAWAIILVTVVLTTEIITKYIIKRRKEHVYNKQKQI